ncbi:MAG: hypothetical protein J0I47_03450 [Sphingomonas sp.]|uniref:hypothetical protein n=1 Tax=Sphingomonas sp. TaxID=28214 RepID=UPI001ACB3581|nr:hypothetical protein [Sphingomonas sp.]MBN8807282.1 hypothetical protein [Sphingomonas sp.]
MNTHAFVNGRTVSVAAALLTAVALGLTGAQTPTMAAAPPSEIAKLAAAGGVPALEAMLDLRSPGFRMPGALTQTKLRRIATMEEYFGPKQRVLSKVRTRPIVPGRGMPNQPDTVNTVDYVTPNMSLVPTEGVGTETPPDDAVGTRSTFAGGSFQPGGTMIFGGGGGSGVGGGGGVSSGGGGDPTQVVTSAVPEPATWLTLIVGFFAVGFGLRNGPARQPRRRVSFS